MDLQHYIEVSMRAARAERMAQLDQLTLGEIIAKCEDIERRGHRDSEGNEPIVTFDFEHAKPDGIDGWRGIYAELALGFTFDGEDQSLSDFIAMLKSAVGKEFTGYKGGEFRMSRHTPVWVANYGNAGNTAVIEVVDDSWRVILMTGYRET